MIASGYRWLKQMLAIVTRVERLEIKLEQEIADIKADILQKWQAVTDKVTNLEATIATNGGGNPAVQAALDDLKQTVANLSVPA